MDSLGKQSPIKRFHYAIESLLNRSATIDESLKRASQEQCEATQKKKIKILEKYLAPDILHTPEASLYEVTSYAIRHAKNQLDLLIKHAILSGKDAYEKAIRASSMRIGKEQHHAAAILQADTQATRKKHDLDQTLHAIEELATNVEGANRKMAQLGTQLLAR